uniref:hypothetical protein n=1 Tax=Streptomyces aureocirculatus TaxID=67275 RepID=UPI0004CA428A
MDSADELSKLAKKDPQDLSVREFDKLHSGLKAYAHDPQHRDVTRFRFTVGQHPEGYAAVEVGQKSYIAQLMSHHLDPALPADQRYAQDPQFVVENVANGSGEVALYTGAGAVGKANGCADPAHPDQRLFTSIQSFTYGREDARAMENLIKAYTKQVEQSKACRPGRPRPSKS